MASPGIWSMLQEATRTLRAPPGCAVSCQKFSSVKLAAVDFESCGHSHPAQWERANAEFASRHVSIDADVWHRCHRKPDNHPVIQCPSLTPREQTAIQRGHG